jgi:CheY-like chemotaxis protein/nitrogen-specific signal transduction histidine kinase
MAEQQALLERAVTQRTQELREANHALGAARDAAESASRAKSAFLANMSHEIRTPMTAILGFTDLLARDADGSAFPAEAKDWIGTVHRNAHHLVAIVNDILDLSKLEAGKMTIERLPVDVAALLQECVAALRPKALEKGIRVSCHVDASVPHLVATDPVRLRQLVANLLSNAVKFTEVGSVRLSARWLQDERGPALSIDVVDTGIGMTPETVARLFKPFEQGDSSMSRRFGGSGLGLSICGRLAELLGGNVRCTSQPGTGSVFTLRVEAPGAAAGQTAAGGAALGANEERALEGVRVLVVDDGADNRKLVTHLLRKAGAKTEVAENGEQGLALAVRADAEQVPFDVVLMDMQMPVMDGYAATRALRAAGYDQPIVALTAHAMASDRAPCIDAGCDDYLSKPVDRRALVACVARHARDARAAAGGAAGPAGGTAANPS